MDIETFKKATEIYDKLEVVKEVNKSITKDKRETPRALAVGVCQAKFDKLRKKRK